MIFLNYPFRFKRLSLGLHNSFRPYHLNNLGRLSIFTTKVRIDQATSYLESI